MARALFADPKTDLVFKRLFGRKSHQQLLICLLNELLGLPEDRRIVEVEYLTPEQLPPLPTHKRSIVDVKCKERAGRRYIVEMQVLNVEAFEKRMVYNASRDYASQIQRGDLYPELNDVVLVSICGFRLWWAEEVEQKQVEVPLVSRWSTSEEATGARRLQQVRYVVMELPKYQGGTHPKTMLDKWAYFFREAERLQEVPPELSEEPLREAMEVARISGMSQEELEEYEREKVAEQDARGMLTLAQRQGQSMGFKEGKVLGLKEGKDLGLKEGKAIAQVESILAIAAARGLALDPADQQRVRACQDLDQLARMLLRAATASTAAQIFDAPT